MVFTAYDSVNNCIVDIDNIPYKSNDVFSYKKRRKEKRYKCLICGTVISEVDSYENKSKLGNQYHVGRHFRCNNKECMKEFKDKKRHIISKKNQSIADVKKIHKDFIDSWLKYFDKDIIYINEGIKIPESKIVVIFSHSLITFEIVKKLIKENFGYKIIIIFDEDNKVRNINHDPTYKDNKDLFRYSINLPKKNDIKYCLDHNFQVFLDTGSDKLLELKDNQELDDCFLCKLVDVNDFTYFTGIYKKQIKGIMRKDYNLLFLFEKAYDNYQKQKENEMKAKICENEKKIWINRRRYFKNIMVNPNTFYHALYD